MSTAPTKPGPAAPLPPAATAVIASWNCAAALRRCLAALESNPDRSRFQVIVADQASQDGSAAIDNEFPGVTVLRLPRNFGRTRARNAAIRTASTGLILLLSPFVEVAPRSIGTALDFLDDHPGCAAAALPLANAPADRLTIPSREDLVSWCEHGMEHEEIRALLVRKSFLQGMNYFDEKRFTQFGAELELFWQLRNAGKSIPVVETEPSVLHPAEFSFPLDEQAQALVYVDRVAGAGAWLGKHAGPLAAAGFRAGRTLASLGKPRRAWFLLSGARIDGTQGGILG